MPIKKEIKQYAIEKLLKLTVKLPSQQGLPPQTLRTLMDRATWLFPIDKSLDFKRLRLAGLNAEEIKNDVLALDIKSSECANSKEWDINGEKVKIGAEKA